MLQVWRSATDVPGWLKVLLVGQMVSSAGSLAWIYLTLYLVDSRGMSPAQAGLVAAAFGAGTLGGNLVGGWLGDRFGLALAAVLTKSAAAVAIALMPFAATSWLAVVALLAGAIGGASRPITSALVALSLPKEKRREGIALSRSASNAGFTVGPPLGGLLAAYNFDLVFVLDGGTSLLMAALIWWKVPRTGHLVRGLGVRVTGVRRALGQQPSILVLLMAVVVVDTAYRQIFTSLPLLLSDTGAPAVAYGTLIAISSVIIVLLETPLAVWLGQHSALSVVAIGFALVGAGLAAIGLWPALGGAVIAMVVITAGEMLYKPTATAHVADAAPDGMTGRFSSLYAAASISGTMLAPALGGPAYEHAPRLIWPVAALAALAAAAWVWSARAGVATDGSAPSGSGNPLALADGSDSVGRG